MFKNTNLLSQFHQAVNFGFSLKAVSFSILSTAALKIQQKIKYSQIFKREKRISSSESYKITLNDKDFAMNSTSHFTIQNMKSNLYMINSESTQIVTAIEIQVATTQNR